MHTQIASSAEFYSPTRVWSPSDRRAKAPSQRKGENIRPARSATAEGSSGKRIDVTTENSSSDDAALARLRKFQGYRADWDKEGAPAPSKTAVAKAMELLALLPSHRLSFWVDLDADARPSFFLSRSKWQGDIHLEDNGAVSFFFKLGDRVLHGFELTFDGRHIPSDLRAALAEL